jgi:hypothetical protein
MPVETWVYLCTKKIIEYRRKNMKILMYFVIAFGVLIGGGSTLAIIVTLFGTIGFKIYRKIKYGMSLYD